MTGSTTRRSVAFVGRHLGARDGISAASSVWQRAFLQLGWSVVTVAGAGAVDHLVPDLDLGVGHDGVPLQGRGARDEALAESLVPLLSPHDLVVVENLAPLPSLTNAIAGRPAILRHHDLPWQESGGFGTSPAAQDQAIPDDPAWRHVTINERSRLELTARGIDAVAVYHRFDVEAVPGRRGFTRESLGIGPGEILVLQPTRAAAPKNVAGGLLLAASLQATYWLFGAVDPNYAPLLEQLVRRASVRVVIGRGESVTLEDAYAASDAVVLPSTWEGFGNAAIEAAIHRRPFSVGTYPVSIELRRYGFSWFDAHDPAPLAGYLNEPNPFVLDRNEQVARVRFSADELPGTLAELLTPR